jgi:hypothetical protein
MASIVSGPLFLQWVFYETFIENLIAYLPVRNIGTLPFQHDMLGTTLPLAGDRKNGESENWRVWIGSQMRKLNRTVPDGTIFIKSSPVIELLDDMTTLIVTKVQAYITPVITMTVSADKSQKKETIHQDKSKQKISQPDCMMPPQPEAYIKCPRYDFL